MHNSLSSAQQPASNVEVLGFTPVAPKPDELEKPSADLAVIEIMVRNAATESNQKIIAMLQAELPKVVTQISDRAVKQAIGVSHASVLGAFKAIGTVLAVRMLLLLTLVGAFVLAWTAMANPVWPVITILISYVLLTVLPLVWLDRNGRRSQNE